MLYPKAHYYLINHLHITASRAKSHTIARSPYSCSFSPIVIYIYKVSRPCSVPSKLIMLNCTIEGFLGETTSVHNGQFYVRFQVLVVASMKMTTFWDTAPHIITLMEAVRTSETLVYLNKTIRTYISESCHLQVIFPL
jgi:hypothetical protein